MTFAEARIAARSADGSIRAAISDAISRTLPSRRGLFGSWSALIERYILRYYLISYIFRYNEFYKENEKCMV